MSFSERLFPGLPALRGYDRDAVQRDLIAGLTVALFTIPQAMAYALIAGFPPSAGIATAIVASILGAAFGSSEFLINGPTNAIAAMLAANAAVLASGGDPQQLVVLLTLMIGIGQCFFAMFRAGALTRFVSEPVLTGFTAGAGLFVAVNQIPTALGIQKRDIAETLFGWTPPHNPLFDLCRAAASLAAANPTAVALAVATIVVVRVLQHFEPRSKRRIPSMFLTVVLVSFASWMLGLGTGPHKVRLVQDIEPVTRALPHFAFPAISFDQVTHLFGPAFAIGLMGAVEAIAIGKALAARVGHSFDANRQLVGEGACNIGAALVGGFAASGSFTRSAVNFDAGAVTRLSCIYSGLMVLAILMLFAPLANFIPLAVLAGMLIHIGFKLVNLAKINLISKATVSDRRVLITTFVAVLLLPDLTYALLLGVLVSLLEAVRRAEGVKLVALCEDADGSLVEQPMRGQTYPPVLAVDLQGELFFAAAEELEQKLMGVLARGGRFVVVRLQQAYNMDHTCAEMLQHVARAARRQGGRLYLSGVRPGMYGTLERAGIIAEIGEDAVFQHETTLLGSTHTALAFAHQEAGILTSGEHI
jgi:SulP family sulfate permease